MMPASAAAASTIDRHDQPFRREGLGGRILPFAVVAALAELSIGLPPGPSSYVDLGVSLALLACTVAGVFVPWNRLPNGSTVVVPVAYTGVVLTLVLATGSTTSGIGVVVLIPLVWTALYHRPFESVVVVTAVCGTELVWSFFPVQSPAAVIVRRIVFYALIGSVISVAVHHLRQRLWNTISTEETLVNQQTELLRQAHALGAAGENLAAVLDADEVIERAVRLAARLMDVPGASQNRAQYMRVHDGNVHVLAAFDTLGHTVVQPFPLVDHPIISKVFDTGEAAQWTFDAQRLGPSIRSIGIELNVASVAYVPIFEDGELDGILTVFLRDSEISDPLFAQFKAIGHMVELALANARAHERARSEAVTDPLTGLANRRGFERLVADRGQEGNFVVLSVDVDGLKQVNDTQGHAVGDALLTRVASVMQGVMRSGDVLYRMGGDEFAVLAAGSDAASGHRIAERILAALATTDVSGIVPSVSIGIAEGVLGESGEDVYQAADIAMYEAKRNGGNHYVEKRVTELPIEAEESLPDRT